MFLKKSVFDILANGCVFYCSIDCQEKQFRFAWSSFRFVQVILFEIDCAIFYTTLHELFCQFISWTNWVNSGKFMNNCWISCQVMADMEKIYNDLMIFNLCIAAGYQSFFDNCFRQFYAQKTLCIGKSRLTAKLKIVCYIKFS